TLAQLVELRIESLDQLKSPAEREASIKQVEADYDQILRRLGEQPSVLRLQGDIAMAKGDLVEAVTVYERAREVARLEGQSTDPKHYEMLMRLARAYRQLGQTGQARALLEQVLRTHPSHLPSRLQLVELLLQERDIVAVQRQVDLLQQHGATEQQM